MSFSMLPTMILEFRPLVRTIFQTSHAMSTHTKASVLRYPERFAQEALGHTSKAVHRAYAKRALMKIPSLEDYEQQAAARIKSPA